MIGKLSLTDNNVCKTKCHQNTPLSEKMTSNATNQIESIIGHLNIYESS